MRSMSAEAMMEANGGKLKIGKWVNEPIYMYAVPDDHCGKTIYVKNYSEWKAHCKRTGHWYNFFGFSFSSNTDASWMRRSYEQVGTKRVWKLF